VLDDIIKKLVPTEEELEGVVKEEVNKVSSSSGGGGGSSRSI